MFGRAIGEDAELRPLEVWEAAEFADHMDRAREFIRPWVGPSFITGSPAEARALLARYAESAAADGARLVGIRRDGVLVGGVMFVSFDAAAGACELGCWLEPAAEGRGLVTRAAEVLIDWAFDVRGIRRIEWRCRGDNARSDAVARRLGMHLAAVRPNGVRIGGATFEEHLWVVQRPDPDQDADRAAA